jgi:hypothetical protein
MLPAWSQLIGPIILALLTPAIASPCSERPSIRRTSRSGRQR